MRLALPMILAACATAGSDAPDAPLETQETLSLPGWATCEESGASVYYPPAYADWIAVRFQAPEPPYEVRSVEAGLLGGSASFAGTPCSTEAEVEFVVFVSDKKSAVGFETGDEPGWIPLASGKATASKVEGSKGEKGVATWTLDEPLLIDTDDHLWVGYHASDGEDAPLPCLAGCENDEEPITNWQMNAEAVTFDRMTSHVDVRVRIGR